MDHEDDIQLKFDGPPVKQLGGTPAEVLIDALAALQRLVRLIGMQEEGRVFGQRVKPSSRVRREFSIVCRPSVEGSFIQPFDVGTTYGQTTPLARSAREQLLATLIAFNSGDAEAVEKVIPDARERWFFADAASGLIPEEESGIQVTIKPIADEKFSFSAERARSLVERFRSGEPPAAGERRISGKLRSIDFDNSTINLKPANARAFRVGYPPYVEAMLQANARRRLTISGVPQINSAGDVTGFERIDTIAEVEGALGTIDFVETKLGRIVAVKPIKIVTVFDFEDKLFTYHDKSLGIDAWSHSFNDLKSAVAQEIDVLWRNYALADEEELDDEANHVRRALRARFRASENAA